MTGIEEQIRTKRELKEQEEARERAIGKYSAIIFMFQPFNYLL
jgi:hypothetical protein